MHLRKAQSAWVQFVHYLGYLLMAMPASWLARKLGYKGGIISGLLLVAIGGFWFVTATCISAFWAFLLGVCVIAMGLTILETVANPYTTVLGPKKYAAARINFVQSFNGGQVNVYNMSVSFLMPLGCFALIAIYGYSWSRLSKVESPS